MPGIKLSEAERAAIGVDPRPRKEVAAAYGIHPVYVSHLRVKAKRSGKVRSSPHRIKDYQRLLGLFDVPTTLFEDVHKYQTDLAAQDIKTSQSEIVREALRLLFGGDQARKYPRPGSVARSQCPLCHAPSSRWTG